MLKNESGAMTVLYLQILILTTNSLRFFVCYNKKMGQNILFTEKLIKKYFSTVEQEKGRNIFTSSSNKIFLIL